MSKENMAGFIEAMGKDQELLEMFKKQHLIDETMDELISFAGNAGFEITKDDLKEAPLCFQAEKLSDEDLGNVSAGVSPLPSPPANTPCPAPVAAVPADEAQQALQILQQQAAQSMQDAQQAQRDIQSLS